MESLPTRSAYDDYMRRWQMLENEYVSGQTKSRQQEVMQYMQPYRGRFELDEQNKQPRKDQLIINSTGIDACKNLSAALLTGISSAARKWVAFTSTLPGIKDDSECKAYFDEFRDVVLQLCAESNFYKVLAQIYEDLVGPATGLMWIEEDDRDVIRAVHRPCGQYRLSCDARGRVSTVYERMSMTVEQVIEQFCIRPGQAQPDLSRLSNRTRNLYDRKRYDDWVDILHVVEPRTLRERAKIDARNKPWSSNWMEWNGRAPGVGNANTPDSYGPMELLLESGFDEQAFIAPRWDSTGEDAYGCNSPGMLVIGDVKSLQTEEFGSAKVIAKLLDPPLNIPGTLTSGSLVPGARNQTEDPRTKVEPTYVPDHQVLPAIGLEKREFEQRIRRGCYGDLLFLISGDQRASPGTAEEIRAKKEERLLALGGTFGRFSDEGLTPALNRIGSIAQRRKLIRPPPAKLMQAALKGGRVVRAEFLNSIAEAQKAQGVQPILGWVNDAMTIAKETGDRTTLDRVDLDAMMETTADMRGVPSRLVVDLKVAQKARAARAQAAAQAQQTAQGVDQAKTYKDLSQSDPEQMKAVFRQFGPAGEAEAAGGGA